MLINSRKVLNHGDNSTSWHIHKIFDKPQEKSGSSLFQGFFIVSHFENQFFDLWFQKRSVALKISSTVSLLASEWSLAWMYLWTPTSSFLSASKLDEYIIFFLIRAVSGHQFIKKSFCLIPVSLDPYNNGTLD